MVAMLRYPYLGQKRPGDGDALGEEQAKEGKIQKKSKGSKSFGSSSQACPDGKHITLAMKVCLNLVLSLMSSVSHNEFQ